MIVEICTVFAIKIFWNIETSEYQKAVFKECSVNENITRYEIIEAKSKRPLVILYEDNEKVLGVYE